MIRSLISSEVGYIPFEQEAANLFFQLVVNGLLSSATPVTYYLMAGLLKHF